MSSRLRVTHTLDESVAVAGDGRPLFRYNHICRNDPFETPKPHFHPVRTLTGNVVTCYRPHDHLWHYGLAMTITHVSGENFWGGNTYVHGEGYKRLPAVGRQEHIGWRELSLDGDRLTMAHRVHWLTSTDQLWLDEQRRIALDDYEPAEGWYSLRFEMALTNVSQQTLEFGSPTTEGRPNAGYGGLMWRGARDLAGGRIHVAGAEGGEELMGSRSPWLAYSGRHDETGGASTLLFIDHESTPGYPIKWFCRTQPALASFAFCFDEVRRLPPGETLHLRHKVIIADGAWDRARLEAAVEATRWD